MSHVISLMLRKIALYLSILFRKVGLIGFKYQSFHFDEETHTVIVSYLMDGIPQSEALDDFLKSDFFLSLPKHQILKMIALHTESMRKIKKYAAHQDNDMPEIFELENTLTHAIQTMSAKSIFENSAILENLPAKTIRQIAQIYLISSQSTINNQASSEHLKIIY